MQLGLIPRRRVLLDNAQLGRAIDNRKRLRQKLGRARRILRRDQSPNRPDLMPQPGLVAPVKLRALFVRSYPLQSGKMISISD